MVLMLLGSRSEATGSREGRGERGAALRDHLLGLRVGEHVEAARADGTHDRAQFGPAQARYLADVSGRLPSSWIRTAAGWRQDTESSAPA